MMADFGPTHPGEVLLEDFMKPRELSSSALAEALGIRRVLMASILRGKCAISPDIALRLAGYFGTSAEFWTGMQLTYEVERARARQSFDAGAEEAMEHYRRTGLHVTWEEVEKWMSTWGTDSELEPPEPHA